MAVELVRIIVAFALLFGIASPSSAQQPTDLPRIGVLWPIADDEVLEAFRQGLRDLGYVEGRDVVLEYRYADGRTEELPALVAELLALDVDVILTWGVSAGRVAKQATTTIPIVNGSMSDPVGTGLVQSLARPGGNLTGLTSRSPVLSAKRLELLQEIVPGLSRVAVLGSKQPTAILGLKEIEAAANSLGLAVQALMIDVAEDFAQAFAAMAAEGAEALILAPDLLFNEHQQELVDLAVRYRLPSMYYAREFVEVGGLVSYSSSMKDQFRRAAGYVDRILKGADPAELPIEQASVFELVINLKTAKELGIEIPPSILLRADEVIE
jgi:putative tryptophan/tyrosine transport system substrate-binding protein